MSFKDFAAKEAASALKAPADGEPKGAPATDSQPAKAVPAPKA